MAWGRGRHTVWSAASSLAARLLQRGERRRRDRGKANVLHCNRGTVVDFSTSGMRLHCPGLYTGTIDVELWVGERRATLRAEVVWSKRLGLRKYEVGFAFRNLTPQLHRTLEYFVQNMCIG